MTKTLDQLIIDRRSIRKYLDKPVERAKTEQALEAARLAPSACNAQPWRFVVVEGEARDRVISEGLGGLMVSNSWAKTAPVLVVVCSVSSYLTHSLGERVQGVQYHLIDIGIAMEHFTLKAAELGLGTCYIGWFNGKKIKKTLNLPFSWKPECLITLGYPSEIPAKTPRKHSSELFVFEK